MSYRPLGRCGTKVSALGLGGWTTFGDSVSGLETVREILRAAFDAGITFFDIADAYGKGEAERAMGNILAEFPRHELVISSKVFFPMSDDVNDRGLSRKHILESVDRSLRRIGTDYLDLYFCHRFDRDTPLEETARAMDDLVRQGKILYWGTSEWNGAQLSRVYRLCKRFNLRPPQVEQPQYSLLARAKFELDVRPAAERHGMGLVVWSPLAFGLLTGKYDDGFPEDARLTRLAWLRKSEFSEDRVAQVRRFREVSERCGHGRTPLALAWALAARGVSSVILGVTRLEQLRENLEALQIRMTPELAAELERVFPGPGLLDLARLRARRILRRGADD
jgi:voltage-dependent potassium channel beta subunit